MPVGDINADVINAPLAPSSIYALGFSQLQGLERKSFCKTGPQFTYSHARKNGTVTTTTIDHCFFETRFMSALTDVSVRPNPIGSDHRMLCSHLGGANLSWAEI